MPGRNPAIIPTQGAAYGRRKRQGLRDTEPPVQEILRAPGLDWDMAAPGLTAGATAQCLRPQRGGDSMCLSLGAGAPWPLHGT